MYMASFAKGMKCIECGREYPPTAIACTDCGGLLDVQYDYQAIANSLNSEEMQRKNPSILDKWIQFLPIEDRSKINLASLGQSATPLIECKRLAEKVGVDCLYLKNESVFPTGSFKDRSMPVAITKALELGAKTLSLVSSGNAAASLAAHGARAGLDVVTFVDQEVASSKLAQILIYGAKAVIIRSDYSAILKLFKNIRDRHEWYDCNSEWNSCRFEGNKTFAFEICEQLDWNTPDWVFSPMGSCTLFAAGWKGFKELVATDLTENLPRLGGIQAENCSPVVNAFGKRMTTVEPIVPTPTIATAISEAEPPLGGKALQALYESQGIAESVSEDEILRAVKLLAKEGIFCEPAGAVSLAGAIKLREEKQIDKNEKIVCLVTGHGLKTPEIAMNIIERPETVGPTIEEVEKFLGV
jgi:threonine synthase